jgi:hypothetical protein
MARYQRQLPARDIKPIENTPRIEATQHLDVSRLDTPEAIPVRNRVHDGHEPWKAIGQGPVHVKNDEAVFGGGCRIALHS